MATDHDNEILWNPELHNLQMIHAMQFQGNCLTTSLVTAASFHDPLASNSSSMLQSAQETSNGWNGQQGAWLSPNSNMGLNNSPLCGSSSEQLDQISAQPHPPIKMQAAPQSLSATAIERRRKQNRSAQTAFRKRGRKQVEEMQQTIDQCEEHNKKMCSVMRDILEKLDALKKEIKEALTSQLPLNVLETEIVSKSESGESFTSPSPDGSPNFDHTAASKG
ncbi:hypothetical protein BP6252_12522 [Coleophoma cylindrospora]|uniref:BZIP domain-containing protein n=1 Tax=Coleophoma cylindrospora TaxID=1849047 RepID=A0A3D8QC43_9HELO|nr:hypothetical protein BP6252_12522 [Coleophoma cylindrospora]